MSKLHDLYEIYSKISSGDLSGNQKKEMYKQLGTMSPEEVQTIDEHKQYIELVQKLRQASMADMELFGQKFLETLKSLLAVGEDGVYSNRLRFLYELIQNVDDCEYQDVSDCNLEIQFRYEKEPGRIILTYNEIGFTPQNVFAITGIAEKSKNISAEKVEIGEKGIGFKSVFGIATKVLIESGMFSFELFADNFTVPIPKYDGFEPVKGTRLTLEMTSEECLGIYRLLVDQYLSRETMLNQNPILFLNKLTHLKMYFDGFRYIVFDVQRTKPEQRGEILLEKKVSVSVDMKDHYRGYDRSVNNKVHCFRYTMPITYGEKECKARYGEDSAFSERKHNLIAVFPEITEEMLDFKGVLYSFLPTQVKTTAPIILHVPYKLGGSREYVDSHNNDAWFTYTNAKLISFLELVYLDLAHTLKQNVIYYIPSKHNYFFRGDRGKIGCIMTPELKGDYICRGKIFYTEDGSFEDVDHIVAFGKEEVIDDPALVHSLLEEKAKLFVPSYPVDMKIYGCKVIENVQYRLFKHGLEKSSSFGNILGWLEKNIPDLSYYKLLNIYEPVEFNIEHIQAVASHGQLWNASIQNARKQIVEKKSLPLCNIVGSVPEMDAEEQEILLDIIKDADLDKVFMAYLQEINYRFYVIDNKKEFAIAASNGVILAKGSELGSFAKLARLFDQQGTFTASIEIRQASEKLNRVDDSMSNEEYLTLLHGVRKGLKDAFGKRMYDSYIKIIAEAGTDKYRFLSEILQNADDCIYPEASKPSFKLDIKGSSLVVSYNECGFTKNNVRAITAIGESTKKLLFSGDDQSIGEKGVGFKSVFGVANSVEIHSNGFNFRLTNKVPTVPESCDAIDNSNGTTMVFQMRQDIRSTFSAERILHLCICLRNLKHLEILHHVVTISDDGNRRVVTVDNKRYVFERIVHNFVVTDEDALEDRSANGKTINPRQKVVCYIPEKIRGLKMFLYAGLPTSINSNVPLIIDAPFELTTSRENILHNCWNDIIREEVYESILDVMYEKEETGLDVLKYVGFHSQNNILSWENFDDEYMNYYSWWDDLAEAQILPVLGSEERVSANQCECLLVPEFIARLQEKEDVTRFFEGAVVDMIGKSQYAPLLEEIGCEKADGTAIYRVLNDVTGNNIYDKEFREGLYAYLTNNQGNTVFEIRREAALTLPIFPVKMEDATRYISYCNNIYTHKDKTSREDYYILDDNIMSLKQADEILSGYGRINELTQEVFDAKYQNVLREYIENDDGIYSDQQIATFILKEFRNNRYEFSKCKPLLLGLLPYIPFKMESGFYKAGNKFLNSREQWYAGGLMQSMVVDSQFAELAAFLECDEVENLHFDDIDYEIDDILDDDIEDLQCDFVNYYEIIRRLIDEGLISDEQIVKYNLEFGIRDDYTDDYDAPYEEFPEKPVQNMASLKKLIYNRWHNSPNPYVEKQYIQWKPKFTMDKKNYTLNMYQSIFNHNKCFCQMCQELTPNRYIERNSIEKYPAFAWEQMYLNLCLQCSKDYILLRNNTPIWQKFVNSIMSVDPSTGGVCEIPIADKTIMFTATHLAEIQEIFKNEGWGDQAPERKPVIGESVDDEEDEPISSTEFNKDPDQSSNEIDSDRYDLCEEDEDEDEEFEDITIYEDEGVRVDFCGIEFDRDSREIKISIWCQNILTEARKFWFSEIRVNGEILTTWELIDEETDDQNYYSSTISASEEQEYFDIEIIAFKIEVDDDDNNKIGISHEVIVDVNTEEEFFVTSWL